MDDKTNPSAGGRARIGFPGGSGAEAERVASRRYILLKGIGRGSAILAAAAPIKTLASTPSLTANGLICTLSGTQSAAISQATRLPTCGGLSPGYYTKISHWPSYPTTTYTVGGKTFTQITTFFALFGGGMNVGLLKIMQTRPHNNDEFHWIAALLNAIKAPPGYVFPYSALEVLSLYRDIGKRADALMFFKGFMETI